MFTGYEILIVEDEVLLALDLSEQLSALGYEPFTVSSAEAAIDLLTGTRFAGLITDIELAGRLSGLDLARQAVQLDPDLPIVVVSGGVRPEAADLPFGARFIAKPYAISSVAAGLRRQRRRAA